MRDFKQKISSIKNIRIIPRLDIKGSDVVKPIQTEALKIVGKPKELTRRYFDEGADEIIYLDIVASLYQRNIDFEQLKSVTDGIFIPVTVGGGIRTISDINNALRAGADKVAINTHLVRHPEFISTAVKEFGAQCIVLFVEAKKRPNSTWEVYTDGGRERTGLDVIKWVNLGVNMGVGEVLISSIDRDGTMRGFDFELIEKITSSVPVPVIVHGGASDPASIKDVIIRGKADAIAISSIFHYQEYLISDVKKYLIEHEINVRII